MEAADSFCVGPHCPKPIASLKVFAQVYERVIWVMVASVVIVFAFKFTNQFFYEENSQESLNYIPDKEEAESEILKDQNFFIQETSNNQDIKIKSFINDQNDKIPTDP